MYVTLLKLNKKIGFFYVIIDILYKINLRHHCKKIKNYYNLCTFKSKQSYISIENINTDFHK